MSDELFLLVSQYGVSVVLLATFLSCLAAPIPTSFIMLAGGAFVASGDLSAWEITSAAWIGAISGDQVGFQIGKVGGAPLVARLEGQKSRAKVIGRARQFIQSWGGPGVFFTRWLFSPLGPYVNVLGGAGGLERVRFTLWGIAGESVWVLIYVGLGYAFADRITDIADLMGNAVGFLAAGAVTVGLGMMLRSRIRANGP